MAVMELLKSIASLVHSSTAFPITISVFLVDFGKMKVTGVFLVAACYGISEASACSLDNCYRALFPSNNPTRLAAAQSFCHTYTQGVSTATTGYPSQFTGGCGATPGRYSSACSCGPTGTFTTSAITSTTTSTTSTTTTTISTSGTTCSPTSSSEFTNGDFECGLIPWRALVTHGTDYALSSPGSAGSSTAFQVTQTGPLDNVGLGEATLSQLFYLTSGVMYTLTFDTFFNDGNGGFIGLKINGVPQLTVDARDFGGPGVWNTITFNFTAVTGQHLLEFEFLFGTSPVTAKIDKVGLTPPN